LTEPTRDETSYDFWVGKWVTSWKDLGGRNCKGTNVILKLEGSVRELFEGHASFRGGWAGDRFVLDLVRGGTPGPLRRLVWHSVKVHRMLWDYELSEDGGRTWASTWHIAYRRVD
jgi:hypothetical protein